LTVEVGFTSAAVDVGVAEVGRVSLAVSAAAVLVFARRARTGVVARVGVVLGAASVVEVGAGAGGGGDAGGTGAGSVVAVGSD
jgi:hypothetical protein